MCVQQPYPVPRGAAMTVVWNIQTTFKQGAFDSGDGRGFVGPILKQMSVGVPNIQDGRVIRLRWEDNSGNTFVDSMAIATR
jgi:hypothetical protein